jgi:hypothetical protein
MGCERAQVCTEVSARTGAGPYRRRPCVDPAAKARLDQALDAARNEMRRAGRAQRRCTGLAVIGYLAAALMVSPRGGGDGASNRCVVVWVPMAAGATFAWVCAHRSGARCRDLEAEIAGMERLSRAHVSADPA